MNNLHTINPAIELTNNQIASIWLHHIYDPEYPVNSIIFIDTITDCVSYGDKVVGDCTMDHEEDWIENGSPAINIFDYTIEYWNSDEEPT